MLGELNHFTEWGMTRYATRTVEVYAWHVSRFGDWAGWPKAGNVTLSHVIGYYRHMRSRDCHDATVAYAMIALRQFFRLLFLERKIKWNYELIGVPKYARNSFVAVEPLEGWNMAEKVEVTDFRTLRDKTMLSFLYASGVRVSELVGLEVSDLVPKRKMAVIVSAKNMLRREVLWDSRTEGLLKVYLREREGVAKCGRVFVSCDRRNVGTPICSRTVQRLVERVRDRPEVSPHSFRHGLGMRAVRSGVHARYIQKILGHRNINSSQCYMDTVDDDLINAYTAIEKSVDKYQKLRLT